MPSRPIYRLDFSRFGLVSPRRKSMFASDSLPRRLVRLLVDVQQRIVQEALDRRCSMYAVVVEALNTKINLTFGETQSRSTPPPSRQRSTWRSCQARGNPHAVELPPA